MASHDSRKVAGESDFYGLSCAGRSAPAHPAPVYSGLLMWIKVAKIGQGANVGMGRRLQLDWLEIAGYASPQATS